MNSIKHIRCQLGLTQKALALGIGCTQGNVWHYEMGQSVPPPAAAKLIAFAATRGLVLTYDDIYANQDASAVTTPAAVRVAAQAVVPAAAGMSFYTYRYNTGAARLTMLAILPAVDAQPAAITRSACHAGRGG